MNCSKNPSADRGRLFILSAPSGAGKTTLGAALRQHFVDLQYSISHTSRKPRKGEQEGVDYFFISAAEFEERIRRGEWAEWAEVHGNYYGTAAVFLEKRLAAGDDILLDIDVQGAALLMARFPDSVSIFIMPPSMEAARARLKARGTDSPKIIETRMANAAYEMEQRHRYRHVIVNDQLADAKKELIGLVYKCRA